MVNVIEREREREELSPFVTVLNELPCNELSPISLDCLVLSPFVTVLYELFPLQITMQ